MNKKTNFVVFDRLSSVIYEDYRHRTAIAMTDLTADQLVRYEAISKTRSHPARKTLLTMLIKQNFEEEFIEKEFIPIIERKFADDKISSRARIADDYVTAAKFVYVIAQLMYVEATSEISYENIVYPFKTAKKMCSLMSDIEYEPGEQLTELHHNLRAAEVASVIIDYKLASDYPRPSIEVADRIDVYKEKAYPLFTAEIPDEYIEKAIDTYEVFTGIDYSIYRTTTTRVMRTAVEMCLTVGVNFIELSTERQWKLLRHLVLMSLDPTVVSDAGLRNDAETMNTILDISRDYAMPAELFAVNPEDDPKRFYTEESYENDPAYNTDIDDDYEED